MCAAAVVLRNPDKPTGAASADGASPTWCLDPIITQYAPDSLHGGSAHAVLRAEGIVSHFTVDCTELAGLPNCVSSDNPIQAAIDAVQGPGAELEIVGVDPAADLIIKDVQQLKINAAPELRHCSVGATVRSVAVINSCGVELDSVIVHDGILPNLWTLASCCAAGRVSDYQFGDAGIELNRSIGVSLQGSICEDQLNVQVVGSEGVNELLIDRAARITMRLQTVSFTSACCLRLYFAAVAYLRKS